MEIAKALTELRAHLGESQQAFATRMGLSVRGVANYEKDRIPEPGILTSLAKTAQDAERPDLAQVFFVALLKQAGLGDQNMVQFASEWNDARTKFSSRLLITLREDKATEASEALFFFWQAMNIYVHSKKPEIKAKARKLLAGFSKIAREEWR